MTATLAMRAAPAKIELTIPELHDLVDVLDKAIEDAPIDSKDVGHWLMMRDMFAAIIKNRM